VLTINALKKIGLPSKEADSVNDLRDCLFFSERSTGYRRLTSVV